MSADRFSPSIRVDHGVLLVRLGYLIVARDFDGADRLFRDNVVEIGNCTGQVNKELKALGIYVNSDGSVTHGAPEVPDPLAAFRARLKVGQLCAWAIVTDAEATALKAKYGDAPVLQYTQFYGASGGGGVNVNVRAVGAGWEFFSLKADAWLPDVGGGGDAYVAWICARNDPPRAVPAPFPS